MGMRIKFMSLNKLLKKSMLSSGVGKLAVYLIKFFTLMLYARFFTPEQFGVLASIQVFVIFFLILAEVGFGSALINMKQIKPQDRDGIFSITVLIGLFLFFVFYLFCFVLNSMYGRDDYQDFGLVLGVAIFFQTITTIPRIAFIKEKKFLHVARYEGVAELAAIPFVFLLINKYPLYALMSINLSIAVFKYLLFAYFSKNTELGRSSIGKELSAVKPLLSFSTYQLAFNSINYFSRNLDNILVAKYIGIGALGVYDKAYQLMRYPLMLLANSMTPAIQPVLIEYKDDLPLIIKTHNQMITKLFTVALIISVYMFLNADAIVYLTLGPQWGGVVDIISIFALSIPFQVIMSTAAPFYQAMNRADLLFVSGVISAISSVGAIISGILLNDIEMLAGLVAISLVVNCFQGYFILYRYVFKSSFIEFIKQFKFNFYLIMILLPCIYLSNSIKLDVNDIKSAFTGLLISGFILLPSVAYLVFIRKCRVI
jgi:O-antigen/teichoic acid export membrane protein